MLYSIYFSLLTFGCLQLVQTDSIEDNETANKLYQQVFDSSVRETLEPAKTLEILKSLDESHSKQTDETSSGRSKELRDIINMTKSHDCATQSFSNFDSQIETYTLRRSKNIVELLSALKIELLLECFTREFELKLQTVSNEDTKDAMLLLKLVAKENGGFNKENPFYSKEALQRAVLSYLKLKAGPREMSKISLGTEKTKNRFRSWFDATVIKLCRQIGHKLDSIVEIYPEVNSNLDLLNYMEQSNRQWIVIAMICREILAEESLILETSYANLLDEAVPRN